MSIYLNKLTHAQVVINYLYSAAQLCTGKDTLTYLFVREFKSSRCHYLLYVAVS